MLIWERLHAEDDSRAPLPKPQLLAVAPDLQPQLVVASQTGFANRTVRLRATFCSALKQVCPPFMLILVYLVLFTSLTASLVTGDNAGEASIWLATFPPEGSWVGLNFMCCVLYSTWWTTPTKHPQAQIQKTPKSHSSWLATGWPSSISAVSSVTVVSVSEQPHWRDLDLLGTFPTCLIWGLPMRT